MTTVNNSKFFDVLKTLLLSAKNINYKPNMQETIVLDLDGTIVYDGSWDNLILPVVKFINYCHNHGIKIIIVTARPGYENNVNKTKESLTNKSIICDRFFFLKPDFKNVRLFKTNAREYITKNLKLNILMSIGDNDWDMGEYGGLGVLMNASQDNITYKILS